MSEDQDLPVDGAAGRSTGRRQYNRRSSDVAPPYFEVFERIAVALERAAEAFERSADAPGARQISLDPPTPRTERPAARGDLRER